MKHRYSGHGVVRVGFRAICSRAALIGLMVLLLTASVRAETLAPAGVLGMTPAPATLEPLRVGPDRTPRTAMEPDSDRVGAAGRLSGQTDPAPRLSGFRNRSRDLFRTERAIEIGEQEMLVRLRLRAKTRRAMSVEVRF